MTLNNNELQFRDQHQKLNFDVFIFFDLPIILSNPSKLSKIHLLLKNDFFGNMVFTKFYKIGV